eukprot:9308940-Pyramimonas_sp.AAC.1
MSRAKMTLTGSTWCGGSTDPVAPRSPCVSQTRNTCSKSSVGMRRRVNRSLVLALSSPATAP